MYPKGFFIEQFAAIPSEELLLKLSASQLTDPAREAAEDLLKERGLAMEQITSLSKAAHKAELRRCRGTTECDYCGNPARRDCVHDAGQRFCSAHCLRDARVNEAALDLSPAQIEARAREICDGACPGCGVRGNIVDIRHYHRVTSILYFTHYERKSRLCCRACGNKENMTAFWLNYMLGWWGLPFGLILTPVYLIANLWEMRQHRNPGELSDDLLLHAKQQLALARLRG